MLQLLRLQLILRTVFWLLNQYAHKCDCFYQKETRNKEMTPLFSSNVFSNSPNAASSRDGLDNETGTESVISHRRDRHRRRNREGHEDGESCSIFPLFHYFLCVKLSDQQLLLHGYCRREVCIHSCILSGTIIIIVMEEFGNCFETL